MPQNVHGHLVHIEELVLPVSSTGSRDAHTLLCTNITVSIVAFTCNHFMRMRAG